MPMAGDTPPAACQQQALMLVALGRRVFRHNRHWFLAPNQTLAICGAELNTLRIRPIVENKSFNFSFNIVFIRCVLKNSFLEEEILLKVSPFIEKKAPSIRIAANSDELPLNKQLSRVFW